MSLRAAATSSLTGPLALQGRQAARGLELWAMDEGVDLELVDDAGNGQLVSASYRRFFDTVPIVIGPYGSNMVRRVVSLDRRDRVFWNHGGSADDLARSAVISLPAPASTYLQRVVDLAEARGIVMIQIVRGPGRFAASVATGVILRAMQLGVDHRFVDDPSAMSERDALVVVGRYRDDVEILRGVLATARPPMVACVAAGLRDFGKDMGPLAEGVIGSVQWLPGHAPAEIGPSADQFTEQYRRRYGEEPGYVAAQAAAAGYLAAEAHRRGMQPVDVQDWHTSTLFGPFALDSRWRQVAHRVKLVEWRDGRQEPIGP